MQPCEIDLLAELPDTNLVRCKRSGKIRWYFKNFLVAFEEDDFERFHRSFANIDFDTCSWGTAGGNRFVIINTCHRDIQLVIKEYEHKILADLFDRAQTELAILHLLDR